MSLSRLTTIVLFVLVSVTSRAASREATVAACLVLEAGGDGVAGMDAVMHVVSNRAKDRKLRPDQVVLQKGQFSTMKYGAAWAVGKAATRQKSYQDALRIVRMHAKGLAGKDPTGGARYFESFATMNKTPPAFFKKLRRTATIGGNAFYRERKR